MILSTLLLTSPFLIQEPGHDIPITQAGDQAVQAYEAWSLGLPQALDYPVQMYMAIEMGMNMPSLGMDMEMAMEVNSISDSEDSLRVWGDVKVLVDEESSPIDWNIDFQAGFDDSGMRFTFDDGGLLE